MKPRWPHQCENSKCLNRGRLWRSVSGKTVGIVFQRHWYCDFSCLEQVACDAYTRLISEPLATRQHEARLPLGLVLLSSGVIDDRLLKSTLDMQRRAGSARLGELLLRSGLVTERQITAALGIQWNCPVFPLEDCPDFRELAGWTPLPILESYHMALVHYLPASQHLYVAFSEAVNYGVLYALEQLFDCRTEPALAGRSAMERALSEIRRHPRPAERLLEGQYDAPGIARLVRQQAVALNAQEVRAVRCSEYVWTHFQAEGKSAANLLFRASPVNETAGKESTGAAVPEAVRVK